MPWMSSSGSPSPRRSTCSRPPGTGTLVIAINLSIQRTHVAIDVLDKGRPHAFSLDDMLKYHGPGSPGVVAQAYTLHERGLPVLDSDGPPERREIHIRT